MQVQDHTLATHHMSVSVHSNNLLIKKHIKHASAKQQRDDSQTHSHTAVLTTEAWVAVATSPGVIVHTNAWCAMYHASAMHSPRRCLVDAQSAVDDACHSATRADDDDDDVTHTHARPLSTKQRGPQSGKCLHWARSVPGTPKRREVNRNESLAQSVCVCMDMQMGLFAGHRTMLFPITHHRISPCVPDHKVIDLFSLSLLGHN